jgi:predicted permease
MLAPLPYREPDRLVVISLNNLTLKHDTDLSYADFLDWQRDARSFQRMAALISVGQEYDLTNPGTAEHLEGLEVSSGYFNTLGVKPALGREFIPQEDVQGGAPVVVISNRLWKERFQGSPQILGKPITLNGIDYAIAGVLPAGFHFWADADVYAPLGQANRVDLGTRTTHDIACFARLRPEVNVGQAQAEMNTIQEHLDQLYPNEERGLETDVLPLKQFIIGNVGATLMLLSGAVGIVLLIAGANVANLLLVRSAMRTREFAIRSALGANRMRVIRQLVTESIFLSLAGGCFALAVARWGLNVVLSMVPGSLPRSDNISVNAPVLLFTVGVSIIVGLLFGLTPALKSSNTDVQTSLKEGGRSSTAAHRRAQSSLMIGQIALTLVLLVGAGLLLRTIHHLWEVNPGFDAQHVVTFKVALSPAMTKTGAGTRAFQQLIEQIGQIPGVQAADLTTLVPLSGQNNGLAFWIDSRKPKSVAEAPRLEGYATGPDYLQVMRIPLLRGRYINRADTISSSLVVVIDSSLAQAYFPNEDPVGRTISFPGYGPYRIIGVVGHVQHSELGTNRPGNRNQAYAAFYQFSDPSIQAMEPSTTVMVRTSVDSATIIPAIKAAVYQAASDQPVYYVQTMQQFVSQSMSPQRFPMILLGAFAALALLLAAVGIYGVISYSVSQRVHEIGIRRALGAERWDVFRLVVGQGLRLVLVGLAIGTVAMLILSRLVSSFSNLLYGVGTNDPLTFIAVSLVLTTVSVLACYVPACRAAKVDPMVVLRHE